MQAPEVPVREYFLGRYVPARYTLAILILYGLIIVYSLQKTFSVTEMKEAFSLSHYSIKSGEWERISEPAFIVDKECAINDSGSYYEHPPVQTSIFSMRTSYNQYAYHFSLVIGARKAELVSAKLVMRRGVVIILICALLTPMIGMSGWFLFDLLTSIGQGIGTAYTYAAMHVLLARWVPPTERSHMTALVNLGHTVGPVISGGLLRVIGGAGVLFFTAIMSFVWCFLWTVFVADSPDQQRLITIEERRMILTSLGNVIGDHPNKKQRPPLRAVMKSPTYLVLLLTYMCSLTGLVTLILWIPIYVLEVYNYDLSEDALTMTVTILIQATASLSLSIMLERLHNKNIISLVTVRKLANIFSSLMSAVCVLALIFVGCNRSAATSLWSLAVSTTGGLYSGVIANHIDIAPNFSGTLIGLSDNIGGVIGAIIMMSVLFSTRSAEAIFIMTVTLHVIGLVLYTLFASTEVQPWNTLKKDREQCLRRNEEQGTDQPSQQGTDREMTQYNQVARTNVTEVQETHFNSNTT